MQTSSENTGQKQRVDHQECCKTLVTDRNISIADVQTVLKSWLQHAGDRISRRQREGIQNESLSKLSGSKKSKSRRPSYHQLSPKSPIEVHKTYFKLERPLFETGNVESGLQDVADVLEVLEEPTVQQTETDSSSQDPIHPTRKTTIVEDITMKKRLK